jgi:hypothetical protein
MLLDDPCGDVAFGMRRFSKRRQLRFVQGLYDDMEGGPALTYSRLSRQAGRYIN